MAGPNSPFIFALTVVTLNRGCTKFSPLACMRMPVFPHLQQQGMLANFLFFARLIGTKQHLIAALISVSLIISHSESLFISSRTIWISFSVNHLFTSFAHFSIVLWSNLHFKEISSTVIEVQKFSTFVFSLWGVVMRKFCSFIVPNLSVFDLWFLRL